jgi:hypothetical protein
MMSDHDHPGAASSADRKRFEAAVVALVAEFIGSLTGLRPPLERALFPPDQEPALTRLCDGITQLFRECRSKTFEKALSDLIAKYADEDRDGIAYALENQLLAVNEADDDD